MTPAAAESLPPVRRARPGAGSARRRPMRTIDVLITRPPKGLPINAEKRSDILSAWAKGQDTAAIAAEVFRHEADVHAVIVEDRAKRLGRAKA